MSATVVHAAHDCDLGSFAGLTAGSVLRCDDCGATWVVQGPPRLKFACREEWWERWWRVWSTRPRAARADPRLDHLGQDVIAADLIPPPVSEPPPPPPSPRGCP